MVDPEAKLECQDCGTITPWQVLTSGPVEKDDPEDNVGAVMCPACYGTQFDHWEENHD